MTYNISIYWSIKQPLIFFFSVARQSVVIKLKYPVYIPQDVKKKKTQPHFYTLEKQLYIVKFNILRS